MKLGIPCPGYKIPVSRIFELQPNSAPPFESDLEKSRHNYFVNVGSRILATFQLESMHFWTSTAPQLGQSHAAVRHGLTALGALQAPMHNKGTTRMNGRPRYQISPLAITHMHKAMHIVRTAEASSFPVEVFLTCCMLFTAMQFWIEKTSSATTHALAAYRIIQESIGADRSSPSSSSVRPSPIPKEFAASFIPPLKGLIDQLCTFSDNYPPPKSRTPPNHYEDFDVEELHTISDKAGAIDALDRLIKSVLRATSETSTMDPRLEKKISLGFEYLRKKLSQLEDLGVLPAQGYDWMHLHLHLQTALLIFNTFGRHGEADFDAFHAEFTFILNLARSMIEFDAAKLSFQRDSLSPHLGVLPPLFLVATRCRDPAIRHEALDLLHGARVSERGWTSCIAHSIARFVVHQEERVLNRVSCPASDSASASTLQRRIRVSNIVLSTSSTDRATLVYEVFSPDTRPDRTVSCKSSIFYPSDPVVEIDGATCPLPRKVLRACGYSGVILFRPWLTCRCEADSEILFSPSVLEEQMSSLCEDSSPGLDSVASS